MPTFRKNPHVKDCRYICKEIQLYYLECPSLVNYEKQKRTRAHIYKHKCMNTHIHTHTQTHTHTSTHAHKHTRMSQRHTNSRERALAYTHTHTKCSFVIGGQSLWNHLPDTVKEAGSIELFKQILKTVVFSQSFEIPAF